MSKNRPYRIATKSQTRRFFSDMRKRMREAYGYENEEVNRLLEAGRFVEGGCLEAIRFYDETNGGGEG